jgi:hypothetical protein
MGKDDDVAGTKAEVNVEATSNKIEIDVCRMLFQCVIPKFFDVSSRLQTHNTQ